MQPAEFREKCAVRLLASVGQTSHLSAFIGLDGFVDEIIHVVDKREDARQFHRLATIAQMGERISGAAGRSTNVELVKQRIKLGGNGPIMANALARLGVKVTYVGALGYPTLHPVFNEFARRAEVFSIAEAAYTDALEFDDGKLLFGKLIQLSEITWPNLQARFSREKFSAKFAGSDLVGFVNWTMIPYMSDIWEALLTELCPCLTGPRRTIFFDLADPEKRTAADLLRALDLVAKFEKYFNVILGLNEKEAFEIREALGCSSAEQSPEGLSALALELHQRIPISTLVIHPTTYALAISGGTISVIEGPWVPKPLITTGAGDHFNAGFCLGKLLGFDNGFSLLTGVTTSGYYVRNGQSPSVDDLVELLREWPAHS